MTLTNTTHYEPESRVTLTPRFIRENDGFETAWPTGGRYLGMTPGGFAVVAWDNAGTTHVAFENLMPEERADRHPSPAAPEWLRPAKGQSEDRATRLGAPSPVIQTLYPYQQTSLFDVLSRKRALVGIK